MENELILRTARLELVPAAKEHAAALFPLMSDDRVTAFLTWDPHSDEAETARVLEGLASAQARDAGYHWTIFQNGTAVGIVSLIDVQRTHRSWTLQRAEIAYWITPQRQGEGLATEATQAVATCAFERLGLQRLRISHTSANPASGRIPQKLGFRFVGTERRFFKKNDRWHDMNHYELLIDDWKPGSR